MSDPDSCRWHTINTGAQARLFADDACERLLAALLKEPATAAALAEGLGQPLDRVQYRLKKLLGAGLIRVERLEKRAGRPQKVYAPIAEGFFVPYSAFDYTTLEDKFMRHELEDAGLVVRSIVRLLRDTFDDLNSIGPRLYRNGAGEVKHDLGRSAGTVVDPSAPDFPAVMDAGGMLRLSFAQAKALQAGMQALLDELQEEGEGGGQRYYARLTLLPVDGRDE